MGYSAVAGRMNKHLSFITFLNDTDQIVFQQYKGIPPINWKNDDLYFLEACQRVRVCARYCNVHIRIIVAFDFMHLFMFTSDA